MLLMLSYPLHGQVNADHRLPITARVGMVHADGCFVDGLSCPRRRGWQEVQHPVGLLDVRGARLWPAITTVGAVTARTGIGTPGRLLVVPLLVPIVKPVIGPLL